MRDHVTPRATTFRRRTRTVAVAVLLAIGVLSLWAPGASAQASPSDGPGGPILVVTGSTPGDAFGSYYAEILRAEGLNEFAVTDKANLSAATLSAYQVVLLAQTSVTDAQASLLTTWVQNGGNLIAMRPDSRLAPLLGLGPDTGDLSEGYLKIATGAPPGAGIAGAPLQFHNTADRRSAAGAATVATLYSSAATPTSDAAVTLRSVGSAGGQAAAFTYDLARSIVGTRQGNVAWSGEERDNETEAIRSDDLFFPDWLDIANVAIPQADEQQRLLANLITQMNLDRAPLPRFWYLPAGRKAAVVLTGDDHARTGNGTVGQFNTYLADSPNGCSVDAWECVRTTSYLFPSTPLSDAQVAGYQAAGFELALHLRVSGPNTGGEACNDFTVSGGTSPGLDNDLTTELQDFHAAWPSLQGPVTNRTHCIVFSDWATEPKLELQHGIRLDTNYYYWPKLWAATRPGMFTGSGFPMRFADQDGSLIDVYQATTQMTDESGMDVEAHIKALLKGALDDGYYGVFTANMHTDEADHPDANDIVRVARDAGVPVVSARQMLTWIDGRNGSSFQGVSFAGDVLRFSVSRAAGARDLQAMVPAHSATGELSQITRNGIAVQVTRRTVKGIDYATFDAPSGDYAAAYGGAALDTTSGAGSTTAGGGGQAPPPSANTAAARRAPRVTIVKRTVRASRKGVVTLRLSCPRGEVRCPVELRLRRGARLLVRKDVSVAGGKSANVTLRLLRSDRLRLVRVRSLRVDAAATVRDVAGNRFTTTTPIRVLAPRAAKRKSPVR